MTERITPGWSFRSYSLRIPADLYTTYQGTARALGVSMNVLFNETLEYALSSGQTPPPWWDEWRDRAIQESLVEGDGGADEGAPVP